MQYFILHMFLRYWIIIFCSYKVTMDDWQPAPSNNNIIVTVIVILIIIGVIILIIVLLNSSDDNSSNPSVDNQKNIDVGNNDYHDKNINNGQGLSEQTLGTDDFSHLESTHLPEILKIFPVEKTLSSLPESYDHIAEPSIDFYRNVEKLARNQDLASVEDYNFDNEADNTKDSRINNFDSVEDYNLDNESDDNTKYSRFNSLDFITDDINPQINEFNSNTNVSDYNISNSNDSGSNISGLDSSDPNSNIERNSVENNIDEKSESIGLDDIIEDMNDMRNQDTPNRESFLKDGNYSHQINMPLYKNSQTNHDDTNEISGFSVDISVSNLSSISSDFSSPTDKSARSSGKKPHTSPLKGIAELGKLGNNHRIVPF
jgi:hypothetical protein